MKEIVRKSEVIGVEKDAFFYLKDVMRKDHGLAPLSEEAKEINWLKIHTNTDGLKELESGSLGEKDVCVLRQRLRDGGFSWVEYGEREYKESCL